MTSYERVMKSLNFQKPDRPPLNFFGTPEVWANMKRHLHVETNEDVHILLGSDMRYVSARYVGPDRFVGNSGFGDGGTDVWGIQWKPVSNQFATYHEIARHPLAELTRLKEIQEYTWPSPDWFDVSHLKEEISRINDRERRAIVYSTGNFFETPWYMRSMERFLMDFVECPEIAEYLMMKATSFYKELSIRAIEASEGMIDIVWSASDVGMQTGLMMSPEIWRRYIKPWHRELIVPFKKMGLKTRYHSDGSLIPIIEDLIEMGLDLLDPIQPKAKGMDADNLYRMFGGRISFYGGIDTQDLLPHGKPEDIEKEVLRYIRTLGADGGYVAAASNAIQPDVPVENILAMFRTARDYTY